MTRGRIETRTGGVTRIVTGESGLGSRMVFEATETGEASDLKFFGALGRGGQGGIEVVMRSPRPITCRALGAECGETPCTWRRQRQRQRMRGTPGLGSATWAELDPAQACA